MSDFNKPVKTDGYEALLEVIVSNIQAVAKLLDSRDTDPANKPVRAKRWDDALARLQSWEGGAWLTKLLGVSGGGTGASTAQGARASLDVPSNADLTSHTGTTDPHNATSAATADRLVLRDASGRAKVAAPAAVDDIARKDTVDTVQANLSGHVSDASHTNDREWTADTVSQGEAEAGTADTRRAWTAQRDRQAYQAFAPKLLHVRDVKAAGVDGGTFTAGDWQLRDLNTVVTNEIPGASLSANIITLPGGTYEISATVPSYRVEQNKARLYNSSVAATLMVGTSQMNSPSNNSESTSFLAGQFVLASASQLLIQHRGTTPRSVDGFGKASNFDEVEVYTDCRIWKLDN